MKKLAPKVELKKKGENFFSPQNPGLLGLLGMFNA
jgi:hypothetical protein